MQAVYIISVTRLPLFITIEIEANLYKLAHTTNMLTANWRAIIFANIYREYVGHMKFSSTDIPESQADSKSLARIRISGYHRQRLQSHRLTYLLFAPATSYYICCLLLRYSVSKHEFYKTYIQNVYSLATLLYDIVEYPDVHVSGCQHPLTAQMYGYIIFTLQIAIDEFYKTYIQNVYSLATLLYDIVEYPFTTPLFMCLYYYRNTDFAAARNIIFMSQDIIRQSLRRRLDGCIISWRKVDIFNNSSNCFISSEELKPVFVFLFLTSF
ncbi:hypothetical protein ALC60_00327 [Trachymyrmex zeteki]|uniref:Uncharacterized protein n=1 Tax=Mycetomoellerius zeteki TaxID=64791 RepID=A0A151XJV6_9HYME|nr:hypothetical protein ALC60_00327 [Trachymyrmex zeteki]